MSNTALTAGALAVSLAATGVYGWHWWKSPGRDPKALIPFAGSYILGGLGTVAGGVLAMVAGWTAGLDNAVGRHAVTASAGGRTAVLNHGTAGQLTTGGHIVAFLFAVGFVVAWKAANKAIKRKLFWGFFCGVTMTLTVGMAGLFSHIVVLANNLGDIPLAWFNGGAA